MRDFDTRRAKESDSAAPAKNKAAHPYGSQGRLSSGFALSAAPIQMKSVVARANDPLERQADAVADRAAHHSAPVGTPAAAPDLSTALAANLDGSASRGDPLPEREQGYFAPHVGRSLRDVRVHADGEAANLADALGAEAFTRGRDVYFAAGRYEPHTSAGRRLLAHELAHVGQQSNSPSGALIQRTPVDDAKAPAKAINAALTAKTVDKPALFKALGTAGRDPTKAAALKTAYKTAYGKELEADLASKLTGDDLAKARFLLNAPPPETRTYSDVTVDKAGTEIHKAKTAGGEISVKTGVDLSLTGGAKFPGGYSIGFGGAAAGSSDARFIQFIWSEVISTQADKSVVRIDKKGLTSAAGLMDLTTDPAKPKYKVDTGSKVSPFYEAGSSSARTATATTIYDRPSEFLDLIDKQFDAKSTHVVERDHFDAFLIKGYNAVYRVSLQVEWVYSAKGTVVRTTTFNSGAAVTALPAELKAAIVKDFPTFEYLQ